MPKYLFQRNADEKLAAENESLKAQLNKMITENQGLITDLAHLEKKFLHQSSAQADTNHKSVGLNNLVDKIAALEKENSELMTKKEENDVEKFEIEEKIVYLEDQIQERIAIISSQAGEIESLQNEIQRLKNPDESVERLKSEIFVLNEKIILLENENASNAEILQELKDSKEELESECSSLQNLKTSLEELEHTKGELEKYKEMNRILRSQLDDCNETRTTKTKENAELENLAKEFEKLKNEKETENQNLQQESDRLKKEHTEQLNSLQKTITEMR